eukprot:966425-Heterocapsa_arctica.AAC.1
MEEQQRQTNIDDEESGNKYVNKKSLLVRKKTQNTQRDCTAGDRPTHTVKTGRLFNNEKEEGTRPT